MDNLTQDPGAGAADVTSSSAQPSGQETQPSSQPNPVDGGTEQEGGQATQYPWQTEEKFKNSTPDDIFKSYREMEKQYSRKAEVANLIEEKYGVTPEQLKQVIAQQEQAKAQAEFQANPGAYAFQEVQTLKQQLALQTEEKQLDGFIQQNPEYAPFRDKILNLGLNVHQDMSYEDIAKDYFGQAIAKGQQDAYQKIDSKKMTQSTGVSTSAPKQKATLEEMQSMSLSELEAILPH